MDPSSQNNSSTQLSQKRSKYQTRQDYFREHRGVAALLFFVIIGLAIGVIIILYLLFNTDDIIINEYAPEEAKSAYFNHRYLLEYSVGRNPAYQMYWDMGDFIISEDQIATAPNPSETFNFVQGNTCHVDIIERSYKKSSYGPDTTFQVKTNVADGRTYTLNFIMDQYYGQNYMGVAIDRTDLPSARDAIIIYTNDPDKYSSAVINWANTYKLNDPEIITKASLGIDYSSPQSSQD